jgi:hypothetical protein
MRSKNHDSTLAKAIISFVSQCLLATAMTIVPARAQIRLNPTVNPIPPVFFGMHIHHLTHGTPHPTQWPSVKFGAWRLWDAYAAWPSIEPERGEWDFSDVDKYVSMAEAHHVELLMPLALSPTWASSRPEETSSYNPGNAAPPARLDDWRDYVRTVSSRYKGRVRYYEIWNEANEKSYYTGTPMELVTLEDEAWKILKEVDPSNSVVSTSFVFRSGVSAFEQFLRAGGGRHADVISFHFYVAPSPPEQMIDLVQRVKALMDKYGLSSKQLWNTESGWAIGNRLTQARIGSSGMGRVLSEFEAAAYVARSYILMWGLGVSRFYYYSWDNKIMGLTEEDGNTAKLPATAYAEIQDWLVGAIMTSCQTDANRTWIASISRDGGYRGWIVWNPDGKFEFRVPPEWHVESVRELLGSAKKLSRDQTIQIDQSPVLLENMVR